MRLGRILFILFAIYLIFLGGSAYYSLVFPVRQLHHILMTVVLAIWLVLRVRQGGLPKTPLNLPILGAVVVWVFSALISIDPRMAFENLWFLLLHVIFFFMLIDLFQRGRQHLVMETLFMVSAVVVIFSGIELASWYFGLGILPGTKIGWIDVIGPGAWLPLKPIRLALAMNISTLLAGFVAPLVTITAIWAFTARRKAFRRILWILAGLLLVCLVLTFSRGGLLSILTAVGTIGALQFTQMRRITQRIPVRVLIGGAIFAGVVIVSGYIIFSITQARRNDTGDAGRLDMWRSAISITRDHPISGIGPGNFGRAFRDYRDPTIVQDKLASAHNAYLNTAAESGLPGIIVSVWLAFVLVQSWYRNWKRTDSKPRKLRLEAAFGALLGIGIHSLVDVFTISPIVLLIVGLAAYCVTPTDMVYEGERNSPLRSLSQKIIVYAALLAVIIYGIWFYQLDRAQAQHLNSFDDSKDTLSSAQAATEIDPNLRLYRLQVAYLTGQQAQTNAEVSAAITGYEEALSLEPTWDTGWINLAALSTRQGDYQPALKYLDAARQINVHNLASLHWAELAEELEPESKDKIIVAYVDAINSGSSLPISAFWFATPMRREAVETFLSDQSLDAQYRVLSANDPKRAAQLVPVNPGNAAEWWVAGEHALTINLDTDEAIRSFNEAIRLSSTNGDFYVSRARARYVTDSTGAIRDLDLADLLGTSAEYPNAIRAEIAHNPADREVFLSQALPPMTLAQEFAAVLYGRPAQFQVLPEMQGIGPGRAAMQPWYTIAEERLKAGNIEGALRAYRAIIEYAPDEIDAREALKQFS